ncbi:ribonuclease Y [Spiroplasma endosymbiont of Asaphidion curtum]|uniref:ribonuclease Y n=1 Tax=Spiroplasma endosymbiont of Asaphidion curtum TaxID=3066281 RepID=UPI00313AC212
MSKLEFGLLVGIFLALAIGIGIGLLIKYFVRTSNDKKSQIKLAQAEREAKNIIQSTKADIKVEIAQMKKEVAIDLEQRRSQSNNYEALLMKREKNIIEREEVLESQYREILQKKDNIKKIEENYYDKLEKIVLELEKVAGLSQQEAKVVLFKELEEKLDLELGQLIKNRENDAKIKAKNIADNIIAVAIEKYAHDVVAEKTTAFVKLPNDEMKGRIIGKEGRNIKAFEQAAGVDIIIDDTPEIIQVSSFNPIRREIAVRTLNSLMRDGRIQPIRIEEVLKKTQDDLESLIQETGQKVISDLGITNMKLGLVYYLGKLRYRTSFGQNALQHCIEVAKLAGTMAAELGLDEKLARRAGLLHDIGKAIDYEMDGSHVNLGVQLAKKYGEHPLIINAIHAHHGKISPQSIYAVLVMAADTLSAARPGARNNSLEEFIQRMQQIEEICQSIPGVQKSYAVQAGRQIRIIVDPGKVSDAKVYKIAHDVKIKIEKEITIPGDIHITVIRELRANEVAR